eukprot:3693849-Pyramimonas_sp.AAC.1
MGAQNQHQLFSAPGVSILSITPDWMHIKHLGLDERLRGSVLFCLAHCVTRGIPEANLATLRKDIWEYYKTNRVKCKFSQIKMSTFTT